MSKLKQDKYELPSLEEKIKSIKKQKFRWFNIFFRNILLVIVVGGLQIMTNWNSRVVFLISGMLMVWISWQFYDYLNFRKKLLWQLNGMQYYQ